MQCGTCLNFTYDYWTDARPAKKRKYFFAIQTTNTCFKCHYIVTDIYSYMKSHIRFFVKNKILKSSIFLPKNLTIEL